MDNGAKTPMKDSIATKILLVVLGLYLLFGMGVTLSHVWMEYGYQKTNIIQDLEDIESAFEDGLAVSFWGMDEEALEASVRGILKIPSVVGVKIINDKGEIVATGGIVTQHGQTGNVGLHVNLFGHSDKEITVHPDELYGDEMFERQFQITSEPDGKGMPLGRATIYSNSSVVYRRMKLQIAMLAANVVLTLLTSFLAVLWAVNRYLRKPLGILTNATAGISLNNLGAFSVDTGTSGQNEIKLLAETMTSMVANLDNAVSQQKKSEASLRESEAKFRGLVESSSDWIWEIDAKAIFTYASSQVETILGYRPEELIGTSVFDLMPPQEAEQVREFFKENAKKQQPLVALENVNLHKDGRRIVLETSGVPIIDANGTLTGYRGVDRDITARKQAESEQQRLEDQLRQAQKMEAVGQLAGGIAHDFNNILTAIQGNAELLKMDLPTEGIQAQFANEITKGSKRAAELTGQLLTFARKGKQQVTPIDIHDIINQTVNMLTHAIDRRIEISLQLDASPSTIMGDPTQLQNAMLNLGVNARDAMPEGGILTFATRDLRLTEADCREHPLELKPGDFMEVSVTDTGVGMDKQTQKRIFEPFFTTKGVGKGTGLGLAGVYGCVRNHDGRISVYSEPGRGTTFKIMLPLAEAGTEAIKPTITPDAPVKGTGCILIVDDEESVRNFVRASLESLGYDVSASNDGAAGVDYYRKHHQEIDMVILDLIMPLMSGQDAFAEMKKINPDVKVLISSGFSHTQASNQMLKEGALALLNKPFQITELAQAVAKYIRNG